MIKYLLFVISVVLIGCKDKPRLYYPAGELVTKDKSGKIIETIPMDIAKKEFACFSWQDIRTMATQIKSLESIK